MQFEFVILSLVLGALSSLTCYSQDLWAHTYNGTAIRNFTAKAVPPHGVVALLLKDDGDEPAGTMPPCSTLEWCMGEDGTRIDQ